MTFFKTESEVRLSAVLSGKGLTRLGGKQYKNWDQHTPPYRTGHRRLLGLCLRVVGRDLGLDGGLNVVSLGGTRGCGLGFQGASGGAGVAGSRASRVSRRRDETTGERAAASRKHEGQWPLTELPVVPLEAAAEAPRPLECRSIQKLVEPLSLKNHRFVLYPVLALRARHRARPSAPAHHAVSNTTTPQLVVYSYWELQGKVCPPKDK